MRTIAKAGSELAMPARRAAPWSSNVLRRIDDKSGEGARTFLKVHAGKRSRRRISMTACAHSALRFRLPWHPCLVKDLFDVAGDVTTAGSVGTARCAACERGCAGGGAAAGGGLHSHRPHQHDGVRVLRARHQPALRHAAEPLMTAAPRRIPGGSSSGAGSRFPTAWRWARSARIPAARAAFRRLSAASWGSSRRPRAFRRKAHSPSPPRSIPIGPLAPTVACCAALDCVLAGDPAHELAPFPLEALRLAVPQTMVLDDVEPAVAQAFDSRLDATT